MIHLSKGKLKTYEHFTQCSSKFHLIKLWDCGWIPFHICCWAWTRFLLLVAIFLLVFQPMISHWTRSTAKLYLLRTVNTFCSLFLLWNNYKVIPCFWAILAYPREGGGNGLAAGVGLETSCSDVSEVGKSRISITATFNKISEFTIRS